METHLHLVADFLSTSTDKDAKAAMTELKAFRAEKVEEVEKR